jgi:hypothetical protein
MSKAADTRRATRGRRHAKHGRRATRNDVALQQLLLELVAPPIAPIAPIAAPAMPSPLGDAAAPGTPDTTPPPGDARPSEPPPCRLRLSYRARALQISVTPWRGVEVIVPHRTSAKRVREFVKSHRSWIARTWEELLALYPGQIGAHVPKSVEFAALGERWRVSAEYGVAEHGRVVEGVDGTLDVHARDEEHGVQLLKSWLRRRAAEALPAWLARTAAETGLGYARCQVRGQRTRWGSCSNKRTIALNYKLLFVRPALVRYLMVHELCHTRFFNHSKRFWALVSAYLPDARALDAELDDAWTQVPGWAGE